MNIAIIGATGLVGREIIKILEEKHLTENNNIFLFASQKSANKKIKINNKTHKVLELNESNFNKVKGKINFALFSAGGEISRTWVKKFSENNAVVIDNSSAFRRDRNVPLIVPEVNGNCLIDFVDNFVKKTNNQSKNVKNIKKNNKKQQFLPIIANPNCSTIGLSLPICCFLKSGKIKKIIVSTYQAVSGAGQKGLQDLKNGSTNKFNHTITNNLIPQIDLFINSGYTFEEDKMLFELRKIFNNTTLKISTTCVRVPITNCHSESVYVEFNKEVNIEEIRKNLKNFKGIKLVDDIKNCKYPMPILCDGKNDVLVGRLRRDVISKKAISFFISFDNIRKGASLNAVQIMEKVITIMSKHKTL